jgi:hypothetical protein
MTDKVEQPQTEQPQTEQAQAEGKDPGTDLNIQDLSAMKAIIDVASTRGAFKPAEMQMVGQTYNKLTAFLDQVAKQAEAQKVAQAGTAQG